MPFSLATKITLQGDVTFTLREDGANVVMDISGSFDNTGAIPAGTPTCSSGTITSGAIFYCPAGGDGHDTYLLDGAGPFDLTVAIPGFNPPGFADVVATATPFVASPLVGLDFSIDQDYVNGAPFAITAALTWFGTDLATIGMAPGTTVTWGVLASAESIIFTAAASGSANGDPHFVRWGHSHHDSFHGECKYQTEIAWLLTIPLQGWQVAYCFFNSVIPFEQVT